MRFDTHRVSAQLINELQTGQPRLRVTDDSGDLIRVSLDGRETVHIYLIENTITVYEIKGIVAANTIVGVYTLFILRRDLLLPAHGARYRPDEWMQMLLALHGDKIYAFDAYFGEDLFVFPVYFEGFGAERVIRHGAAIDATRLAVETVRVSLPLISGTWRVATFEARQSGARTSRSRPANPALTIYYRRLGLSGSANRAAVKRAFRRLARRYHPDLNTDPGATAHMQQINEAYDKILAYMDHHSESD